ncbi:MAG: 1,4-dihydroxy-2-naphthoate octaprenyltransferase [Rhodocyclaceae bacterium]|jgi:1,4-dihydroxy-2-naphthoate octaprenyltransferase|nr:1,4-dihydroxy-2-naphthoate octaprenyltransferase [Rhodocyclaceae bacterium]
MNLRSGTAPAARLARPRGLALWWLAIRPRTLSLAAMPVLVGSALAWRQGAPLAWLPLAVALLCALLIQAGTNLYNDAGDFLRGNDGPTRLGPARVTAAGLATPSQVRRAAALTFGAALLGGVYLVALGGWPIFLIGLASLAAGWAYSGGPRPLSHSPWGEVCVLLFFGLAAVAGSHYLQSSRLAPSALVAGLALGAHAAAVLLVNNVRDVEADRRVGRRTLAILLGPTIARWLYLALMLTPFPLLAGLDALAGTRLLPTTLLALPVCLFLGTGFLRPPPGALMNRQLARTAQAQMLLAALFCLACLG